MKSVLYMLLAASALFVSGSCGSSKKKQEKSKETPEADTSKKIITGTKTNPYVIVDVSPMDISYYPVDYPKIKMTDSVRIPRLFARIIYSRPHLQGRHLFHDLLKYGEPWRLGANESTELELYSAATIQGKTIKAGRYVLYCIPQPDSWTIVLNSNIDSWGLHPDPAKDIARFTVPVTQTNNRLEYFTMLFEKTASGASIIMAWDNLEARLPVEFDQK